MSTFGGSFVANGSIAPSRFVKLDSTATGKVVAAGAATDKLIGVSQQGTRNPSYPGLDDGFCAIAGENVRVYLQGEECLLEVDAAYSPGQLLIATTAGLATASTADGDIYGAIQLDASTAANQLVKCRVMFGYRGV